MGRRTPKCNQCSTCRYCIGGQCIDITEGRDFSVLLCDFEIIPDATHSDGYDNLAFVDYLNGLTINFGELETLPSASLPQSLDYDYPFPSYSNIIGKQIEGVVSDSFSTLELFSNMAPGGLQPSFEFLGRPSDSSAVLAMAWDAASGCTVVLFFNLRMNIRTKNVFGTSWNGIVLDLGSSWAGDGQSYRCEQITYNLAALPFLSRKPTFPYYNSPPPLSPILPWTTTPTATFYSSDGSTLMPACPVGT